MSPVKVRDFLMNENNRLLNTTMSESGDSGASNMIPKIGTRFWESKLNRVSSSQQWINSVVYNPTHFHHQTSCSIGYIYYLKHIHFLQNIIFFKRTSYRMYCPFEWPGCQAQSLYKEASRYFNSTVFNEL